MQFSVELEGVFQCFRGMLDLLRCAETAFCDRDSAFVNRKGEFEPLVMGFLFEWLCLDVCRLKMHTATVALLPVR